MIYVILSEEKVMDIVNEMFCVWCLFVEKFGMWVIKLEFEDLCFVVFDSENFDGIMMV